MQCNEKNVSTDRYPSSRDKKDAMMDLLKETKKMNSVPLS